MSRSPGGNAGWALCVSDMHTTVIGASGSQGGGSAGIRWQYNSLASVLQGEERSFCHQEVGLRCILQYLMVARYLDYVGGRDCGSLEPFLLPTLDCLIYSSTWQAIQVLMRRHS